MNYCRRSFLARRLFAAFAFLSMVACTPTFNWRDISSDAAYVVAMPAKPSTHSRAIDLNGTKVSMTMTAAEVGNITFAVGGAELPDAPSAQVSLNAMKLVMVRNINGTIKHEKVLTMPQSAQAGAGKLAVTEVEAVGPASAATDQQPRVLFARFVARENRVYQLIATGPVKSLNREIADTFFSSFRLN